jgi:hypothetical protein
MAIRNDQGEGMMNQSAPIRYREFWDVPRIFLLPYQGNWFLFDCPFDESTEDFPDSYRVYLIPEPSDEELAGSWDKLHVKAVRFCGEVPIAKVHFDPSKRREIDTKTLDELLAQNNGC